MEKNRKKSYFALAFVIILVQTACLSATALPTPSGGAATLLALTTTPGSALPSPTVRPTITRTVTPTAAAPQVSPTAPGDLMPAVSNFVLATPQALPGTPIPRPDELITADNIDRLEPLMVFGGGVIQQINFSSDGRLLAVVTSANRLLFNAGTLDSLPYDEETWQAAIGPAADELAAVQLSDGVYVERALEGELIVRLEGAERLPETFSQAQDMAAVFLNPAQIGVWEIATGELLRTLDTRQANADLRCEDLMDPRFSPDGQYLAAGCRQAGRGYIWRIEDAVLVQILETDTNQLGGLSFSRDSRLLAGALPGNQVRIWRVRDGALQKTLTEASGSRQTAVGQTVFSPDGYYLVGGFINGELLVWRVSDGELLRVLQGPGFYAASSGEGLVITPDGTRLIYASWDQILVRSAADGRVQYTIKSELVQTEIRQEAIATGFVRSLSVSPDSRFLAAVNDDGSNRLNIYWLQDGVVFNQIALPEEPLMLRSALLGDVLVVGAAGNVYVMRYNGQPRPISSLAAQSENDRLECLAVSPDGNTIAVSRQESGLRIWDWQNERMITDLGLYPDCGLQFSPGGTLLAAVSEGELTVNNVQSWDILRRAAGLEPRMAFSPSGDLLLAVNTVSQLQAVDLVDLEKNWPGLNSPALVSSLAFHPAGRWFAAAYLDGTVRIFGPN